MTNPKLTDNCIDEMVATGNLTDENIDCIADALLDAVENEEPIQLDWHMTDNEIECNAVAIAEGWYIKQCTEEQQLKAWQHLINTGECWHLQGWFGRTAMHLIRTGYCEPSQDMIDNGFKQ